MDSNDTKSMFSKGSFESVTPSPKKPGPGASSLCVVDSAPAKAIPESVASPTAPSPFTVFETPEFDDDNISAPPAERKSSLNARNNIKRALHQENSDNERLSDARGDRNTKKKRKTHEVEKILIGHHCKEPRVHIFALEKSNGELHIYATGKDVFDPIVQRKWGDLVPRNNIVHIEKVILDKKIFSDFGEIEGWSKVKKLQLIKKYLASKKGTSMKHLDSSLANPALKYSCDPPYLHVGYFKNDKELIDKVKPLPVQAQVVYVGKVGALKFRVLDADAEDSRIELSGKRTFRYEQVRILPEYLKETREETKAYIKTYFTMKFVGTLPGDVKPSGRTTSSIILGSEEREISRPIGGVFVPFDDAPKAFRATLDEYQAEQASREAKSTSDGEATKDFENRLEKFQKPIEEHDRRVKEHKKDVVEYRKRVKELEKSVETHNKSVEEHKKVVKELERQSQREKASGEDKERLAKKESRIKELEKLCLEREKQITDLHAQQDSQIKELEKLCLNQEEQIVELQAQVNLTTRTQLTQTITNEPAAFAPELSLNASQTFEDTFDLIPDGEINAGMFMEKQHQRVMIGGKTFKKRRYLQHPSLAVTGTPDSELNMSCGRFGSTEYTTPDGPSKLVEMFSSESLVRYNGRFMIQWVVLKELDYTI